MNIKCHLRDHRIETSNNTPDPTTSAFLAFTEHSLFQHTERPIYVPSALSFDIEKRHDSHRVFIVHVPDRGPWISAVKENKILGHVVFASTQRVNLSDLPKDCPERCHACEWLPSDFAQPPARLGKWLEQVQSLKIGAIDWDLLWRDATETCVGMLAFRLLCEATSIVEEESAKRMAKGEQTSNTAELSTITIHAPTGLDAWLAPFGKSKPEEISQVAGLVGSGVVKEAAEKVLNAVNRSGDLSEAIADFLKLSEPQNP